MRRPLRVTMEGLRVVPLPSEGWAEGEECNSAEVVEGFAQFLVEFVKGPDLRNRVGRLKDVGGQEILNKCVEDSRSVLLE